MAQFPRCVGNVVVSEPPSRLSLPPFTGPQKILKMLKRLMIVVVLGCVGLLSISGMMATMLNIVWWM